MSITRRSFAPLLIAATVLSADLALPGAASASAAPDVRPGAKVAIGFFTQWSIYNGFLEKNLISDGAAGNLTEINYAFSSVSANGLCTSCDSWADYQRPFAASEAVSGAADVSGQALAGNFNQLRELKAKYPKLKIVMTIGGWSWSGGWSATPKTSSVSVRAVGTRARS